MRSLAHALLLLAPLGVVPVQEGDADRIHERLRLLDSATGEVWLTAFAELTELGEEAAHRALEDFDAAGEAGRRSRARLLAEAGGVRSVERVLELVGNPVSPEPGVRRYLVQYLGRPALGSAALERRLDVLVDHAVADPSPAVREAAVTALGETGLPEAVLSLDSLLDALPPSEGRTAAEALAGLPAGRTRLVARVQAELARDGGPRLADEILAVLLEAYGTALAEIPGGGVAAAERAPLVLGRAHASFEVRRAASRALDEVQMRLVEYQEYERADRLLADLAADGLAPRDLLYRRAHLALADRGDARAALDHAEALLVASAGASTPEERTWRYYALHFQAAAHLALEDFGSARAGFEEASRVLSGLLAEREDLRPSLQRRPDWPISPFGGSMLVDRLLNQGLEEVWLAVCSLAERDDPGDPELLRHLRSAHEARLRAQLVGLLTDARLPTSSVDDFLDRDLGPRRLLFSNPRLEGWGGGGGIDLQLQLGRALASVSPGELPGFEPVAVEDPAVRDPYLDDLRFSLLVAIQDAEYEGAWRAWWAEQREMERRAAREDDPSLSDPDARRSSAAYWRVLAVSDARRQQDERLRRLEVEERQDPARRRELYTELARFRTPSTYALTLAGELRAGGRAEQARELSTRMLADIRDLQGVNTTWSEWVSARLEMSIGSSFMDEDRPEEAEREYLKAEERLAALENTLEKGLAEAVGADDDPARRAGLRSQVERTRALRADNLLSLAVNANVRLGDAPRALEYFERAFELDQRDFMRVLLACYRARSGRVVEARAVLRGLRPAPPLFYNLACTHALLGDTDEALDYLQRDFEENHATEGSLRRQKEWAASDPDLASLSGHPRFERLVGR